MKNKMSVYVIYNGKDIEYRSLMYAYRAYKNYIKDEPTCKVAVIYNHLIYYSNYILPAKYIL